MASQANAPESFESASILVVDDNPVNRKVLRYILQSQYAHLETAEDGEQCLHRLTSGRFDLVMLDLNMPLKSGFDVLQEVGAMPLKQRPTFIVVSADNNPSSISRALRLGASDYVSTPFNRDELLARVKTHLALRSRELDLENRVKKRTAQLQATNEKLREAQHQLVLAEKMASLGQLSAGIAHEINNPIGYVASNLDSLKHYVEDLVELIGEYQQVEAYIGDESARRQLEQKCQAVNLPFLKEDVRQLIGDSLTGVQRVKQIVSDLKVFSHPEQRDWEALDLNDCIRSVLNIVNSEIKYKADIVLQLDPNLPTIACITTQMYQVITNLVVNAAQAIEKHGEIRISTRSLKPSQDSIEVEICDNGSGMSQAVKHKIFDPFFTTKAVGQGTGLGLSISYGIIEGHRGSIDVDTRPGEGTCFTLTLPISQGE
ncbi:response regulator [Pseudomaricurvus alkylphenolicus]|uniref:response regulator n=1 Tax=Pseudomaricurvus alkylphenolicus TaxID=1306991 RepID=UPI001422E5C1|nr:response regulator [Pseudomaricurvus alkylphenolicus]NIB44272.1 response regulator [Pseudomaricurvus alkylphenolicus]